MAGKKGRLRRSLILLTVVTVTLSLVPACEGGRAGEPRGPDEPYRPQYHFTPVENWMNDPNGLVYDDGQFHLFYQHNPADTVWGPMHWGHAVGTDLVNWQHLPIALYPDDVGNIFSGSAVIDRENTAGFGAEAMVAVFTHESGGRQMQSLAYSTDKGCTWTKFQGNPVIEPPGNMKNFRDPKVFWYDEGDDSGHWVMAVAAGTMILFYTSPNLLDWSPVSSFGIGYGAHQGVWETPDLFELPVDGGPETRWMLAVAVAGGTPAGGTGAQYFVGDFDGQTFTSENPKETVLWVDYGADFYAQQSWNNAPDERRIWVGWMNSWAYAEDIPTSSWRGALTLPRQLALTETREGIRLLQQPVPELESLREEHWQWRDETVAAASAGLLEEVSGRTLEIIADFVVSERTNAVRFGFRVRQGDGEETTVGYVTKGQTVFLDRSSSGQVDFNPNFQGPSGPGIHTAPMRPVDGIVRLHIFVDRSSVELFGNDGHIVITDRIFPAPESSGVELFADDGQVSLEALDVYALDAATLLGQPDA